MTRIALWMLAFGLLAPLSVAQTGASPPDEPAANPARPTISTPATLTPVGYLQFETGTLGATHSPEFSSQVSMNEVVKLTVAPRLEFLAISEPVAHSSVGAPVGAPASPSWGDTSSNFPGDLSLGVQGVLFPGEGAKPTISLGYSYRVYGGDAPDLDIGSAKNSVLLLMSADVWGFHYDTNYIFNEQVRFPVHRAQFGQTLSVSHHLVGDFSLTGEIWRFTQPFLRGNAIGTLWSLGFTPRANLVFDAGLDRGLTFTSTRWEGFAGFTYLLPHRLW